MSSEISTDAKVSSLNTVTKFFISEAEKYFSGSKTVGRDRAKQLALGAFVAANTSIEASNGATWENIDIKKFAADMFRMIGYGLDFGNKECYVVPYKNPKTGKYDLQTPVSADGWVKLAKTYSVKPIKDFKRFMVREGDDVTVEHGNDGDTWSFKPKMFNAKPVVGYLTVVIYEDGTNDTEITTLEDVAKRRKASKAPDSPAWKMFPDEMGLAKATRKHMKRISITLPEEIEALSGEYEPVTKDMGEAPVSKIDLAYIPSQQKPEPVAEDKSLLEEIEEDIFDKPFTN